MPNASTTSTNTSGHTSGVWGEKKYPGVCSLPLSNASVRRKEARSLLLTKMEYLTIKMLYLIHFYSTLSKAYMSQDGDKYLIVLCDSYPSS